MLNKFEILKELEKNKSKIQALGVKKISLFGSYARNEENKNSDIDFIVEFEKGRGLFRDYSNLLNLLKSIFKKNIDIVKKKYVREEIIPYIKKDIENEKEL
ncbi:MAG: nucleotidyltransferase family protein [Candidatus Woesearchaeota archaeon]